MGAFLDAASGAPLHPVARQAVQAAWEDGWADPARRHSPGRRARLLLDAAREALADALGARPDEIATVGNSTQALHLAVLGTLAGAPDPHGALVHSAVEHSAVLHAAEQHVRDGGRAVAVAVDARARVDLVALHAAAAQPGVSAVALQAANHEVGTVQPVDALDVAVPVVVDATQAAGHAPLPQRWSVLAADARTWGGPDLGVLAIRTGTRWRSPWPADDRDSVAGVPGVPGVPDVVAVVAAAASLRAVLAEREEVAARHRALVDRLREAVPRLVPDVVVLGDPTDRLPHLLTFSCLYVDGETLLDRLDRRGFAVSSGSSCTSSTLEPSHVLVAMGALTSGNVRVSLHRDTTADEVEQFLAVLPGVVAEVRRELGADGL